MILSVFNDLFVQPRSFFFVVLCRYFWANKDEWIN